MARQPTQLRALPEGQVHRRLPIRALFLPISQVHRRLPIRARLDLMLICQRIPFLSCVTPTHLLYLHFESLTVHL